MQVQIVYHIVQTNSFVFVEKDPMCKLLVAIGVTNGTI